MNNFLTKINSYNGINDNDEGFFPESGFDPGAVRVPVGVRPPVEHVGLRTDRRPLLQDVVRGFPRHRGQALGDLIRFGCNIIETNVRSRASRLFLPKVLNGY